MATLSDLKQDHKNARKRTQASASLLQESLQRYGPARSIVIDEDNRILAGNGTVEAAINLGIDGLRIIDAAPDELIAVRRTGLSEDQKVGLALADNRTADLAEWDAEMLQQLSKEHDIAPWFQEDDLETLLEQVERLEPVEGNTDPDEVPEAPEQPITKPGDLWILGNHRLLCGDSTNIQHVERLMDGKKADITITSPPYGVNLSYKSYKDSFDQTLQLIKDVIPLIAAHTKDYAVINFADIVPGSEIVGTDGPCQYLMGGNYFEAFRASGWVLWSQRIWKKPHAKVSAPWTCNSNRAAADWEHIYTFASTKPSFNERCNGSHFGVIDSADSGESKVLDKHPGAFPVFIPETLIPIHSKPNAVVLEPFGGTGTTLIACERLGRKARLMELDPAYCDVIIKRWEDFTGNTAICHPSNNHFANTEDDI